MPINLYLCVSSGGRGIMKLYIINRNTIIQKHKTNHQSTICLYKSPVLSRRLPQLLSLVGVQFLPSRYAKLLPLIRQQGSFWLTQNPQKTVIHISFSILKISNSRITIILTYGISFYEGVGSQSYTRLAELPLVIINFYSSPLKWPYINDILHLQFLSKYLFHFYIHNAK